MVILDHSIVNERDFTGGIEVGVRVLVVHAAVGGPAGVTDPELSRRRTFREKTGEVTDAAGAFARLHVRAINDGHAGGVVAPVFETT